MQLRTYFTDSPSISRQTITAETINLVNTRPVMLTRSRFTIVDIFEQKMIFLKQKCYITYNQTILISHRQVSEKCHYFNGMIIKRGLKIYVNLRANVYLF